MADNKTTKKLFLIILISFSLFILISGCNKQKTHFECSDGSCIKVDGAGTNECTEDSDCYHKECSNGDCVKVNERGDDSCINDDDCKLCIEEGEEGSIFNEDVCCEGLEKISNSWLDNGECMMYKDGSFICAKCGNGECGKGENECNCPEDCTIESKCEELNSILTEAYVETESAKGQEEIEITPIASDRVKVSIQTKTGGDLDFYAFYSVDDGPEIDLGQSNDKRLITDSGLSISKDHQFIVSSGGYSHLLEVINFDESNQEVVFKNLGLGTTFKAKAYNNLLNNGTFDLDGYKYRFTALYDSQFIEMNSLGTDNDFYSDMIKDKLNEGDSKSYDIAGKNYDVEILIVADLASPMVKLKINGENTDSLQKNHRFKLSDGSIIGIYDITLDNEEANGMDTVEFYISCGNGIEDKGTILWTNLGAGIRISNPDVYSGLIEFFEDEKILTEHDNPANHVNITIADGGKELMQKITANMPVSDDEDFEMAEIEEEQNTYEGITKKGSKVVYKKLPESQQGSVTINISQDELVSYTSCGDAKYDKRTDFNNDRQIDPEDKAIFTENDGNEEWCTEQLEKTFDPCESINELPVFEDYPLFLIKDNQLDAIIVLGDNAPTEDAIAIADIALGLSYIPDGENIINIDVGSPILASEVSDPEAQNMILVGRPIKYAGAESNPLIDNFELPDISSGQSLLKIATNGDYYAVIVTGKDKSGPMEGAKYLKDYDEHSHILKGREILIGDRLCTDSDGGKNYSVKGEITGELVAGPGSPSSDMCIDDIWLMELFCNDEAKGEPIGYECPNGCSDGACIKGETEIIRINGEYTVLNENFPDDVYSSIVYFYTGSLPNKKRVRTLLNFDLTGLEGKEIKKVKLVIKKVNLTEQDEANAGQLIDLHKVTSPWKSETASWNNQPKFDTIIIDSQEVTYNGGYTFTITPIMQFLIEHEAGILLKAEDEETKNLKKFDEAYLNIWYTEEEETESCAEMGGNCRYISGCRNDETETDYECPFWSKCCMPD